MALNIFIGSATEQLDEVGEIAAAIDKMGHHAIPWDRADAFPPGAYTQRRLIDLAKQVDAALFVFGPDDRVEYRGEPATQPRDNVLMEYGLFLGQLPERNTAFYRKGATRTARDVDGVTAIAAPNGWNNLVERTLRTWVSGLRPSWLTPNELEMFSQPAIRVYQTVRNGKPEEPILEDINSKAKIFFSIDDADLYIGQPSVELMKVLQGYVMPPVEHWDDLVRDQTRVAKRFDKGINVTAQIAVRFNPLHGHYPGRIFVPLIIERWRKPLWGNHGYGETSTVMYLDVDRLPKHVFGEQIWKDVSLDFDLTTLAEQFDRIAERLDCAEPRARKVKQAADCLRHGGGPRVLELCSEVGLYSMLERTNGMGETKDFLTRLLDPFPDDEAPRSTFSGSAEGCGRG